MQRTAVPTFGTRRAVHLQRFPPTADSFECMSSCRNCRGVDGRSRSANDSKVLPAKFAIIFVRPIAKGLAGFADTFKVKGFRQDERRAIFFLADVRHSRAKGGKAAKDGSSYRQRRPAIRSRFYNHRGRTLFPLDGLARPGSARTRNILASRRTPRGEDRTSYKSVSATPSRKRRIKKIFDFDSR